MRKRDLVPWVARPVARRLWRVAPLLVTFGVVLAAFPRTDALWFQVLTTDSSVSTGVFKCPDLKVVSNPAVESGGKTTFTYKLTGGGANANTCKNISYVALPVCFNPELVANGGLVVSETHPGAGNTVWTYAPQNGGPYGKRVKWESVSAGSGPFNATFSFKLDGTNIQLVDAVAQTHAGSGSDPVPSGTVKVPACPLPHEAEDDEEDGEQGSSPAINSLDGGAALDIGASTTGPSTSFVAPTPRPTRTPSPTPTPKAGPAGGKTLGIAIYPPTPVPTPTPGSK